MADTNLSAVLYKACDIKMVSTGVFRNSALGVYLVFRWK